MDQDNATTATYAREKLMQLGNVLLEISEKRGTDLLVGTLRRSNYALLEKDTITLLPGGIPCNFTLRGSKGIYVDI